MENKPTIADLLSSDETDTLRGYSLYCDPCLDGELCVKAAGYCVDCCQNLCKACFDVDRTPYRQHQLLGGEDIPKEKSDKHEDKCKNTCDKHEDKIVEFYCRDHRQFGCSVCVTIKHKVCDVQHIPELSKDLLESEEFKEIKLSLKSSMERAKLNKNRALKINAMIDENAEKLIDKLVKVRKELNEFWDAKEKEMKETIQKVRSKGKEQMDVIFECSEAVEKKLINIEEEIVDKEKKNQKCQLFVDCKELKYKLKTFQSEVDRLQKTTCFEEKICQLSLPFETLIRDKSMPIASLISFHKPQPTKPHKEPPSITEISILPRGRMAVLDSLKSCLQIIDTEQESVTMLLCKCNTWAKIFDLAPSMRGLTKVSNNEIAVLKNGKVCIFEVSDHELKEKITVKTRKNLARPLVFVGGVFVARSGGSNEIISFDKNGIKLKTLNCFSAHESDCLVPFAYAASSEISRSFYISSWPDKTLTRFSVGLEVIAKFQPSWKWDPRGVVVSRDGIVYVSDWYNSNIVMLTADLNEVGVIHGETFGFKRPLGLAYCDLENKLYVGMGGNAHIRVLSV